MQKAEAVLKALNAGFPRPTVELNYANSLELLVATILSAQCTDPIVNQVTEKLFKKYQEAPAYAGASQEVLEKEIRPTGFYRNKARNIIRCCRALENQFGGRIPDTMEELTSLPGVGRKTASVILGNCFGKPAIVVDTHVLRVSRRLGLTHSGNPDKVEKHLARQFPPEQWVRLSHQLILHGRTICKARAPLCLNCGMKSVCAFYSTQRSS